MNDNSSIDNKHGYCVFIITLVCLQCISYFIARRFMPKAARADLDPWRWRNLVISWVHGLICGSWSLLCLIYHPEFLEDLVTFKSTLLYLMVAFSSGYFLYDLLDILINKKVIDQWEVTLHHIFVVPGFWYNWHFQVCLGYCLVALTAEINSFFLHSRKLLQLSGVGYDTSLYRTCSFLNLFTFVFCRIIPITFILYSEYLEVPRYRLPIPYMICFIVLMVIVAIINYVLFWRLFKSDFLRPYFKNKQQKQCKINANNNIQVKDE